jgi:hypothetical protein
MNTKKIYDYLFELTNNKIPTEITFNYSTLCENLIIEIFSDNPNNPQQHKYLTTDNLVFYVGLIYNILITVEKKLNLLFDDPSTIDYNN